MTKAEIRIKEVISFFKNRDIDLGYRKLIDCAIDTQDLTIYDSVIKLTDWKENNPLDEDLLIIKSLNILDKIGKIPITECDTSFPVVKGTELKKSCGVNRFTLGPISIEIHKGEIYGLVGENRDRKHYPKDKRKIILFICI